MNNPYTVYNNQIQNNQTVRTKPNTSNDLSFKLNTTTTTLLTLPIPPWSPLIFGDAYSMSSANNIPMQTNTNSNATANPCEMLHQPHINFIILHYESNKPFFSKNKKLNCTFCCNEQIVEKFA